MVVRKEAYLAEKTVGLRVDETVDWKVVKMVALKAVL